MDDLGVPLADMGVRRPGQLCCYELIRNKYGGFLNWAYPKSSKDHSIIFGIEAHGFGNPPV